MELISFSHRSDCTAALGFPLAQQVGRRPPELHMVFAQERGKRPSGLSRLPVPEDGKVHFELGWSSFPWSEAAWALLS
jgi:hypothetical protein